MNIEDGSAPSRVSCLPIVIEQYREVQLDQVQVGLGIVRHEDCTTKEREHRVQT